MGVLFPSELPALTGGPYFTAPPQSAPLGSSACEIPATGVCPQVHVAFRTRGQPVVTGLDCFTTALFRAVCARNSELDGHTLKRFGRIVPPGFEPGAREPEPREFGRYSMGLRHLTELHRQTLSGSRVAVVWAH